MRVAQAEAGTRFLTVEARDALSALLAALPLPSRQTLAEVLGHAPPPRNRTGCWPDSKPAG